jgi:hypothetical protein
MLDEHGASGAIGGGFQRHRDVARPLPCIDLTGQRQREGAKPSK